MQNQIRVGGQNIKMLGLIHLRSMFGLVGQEPVLFDTTVKENIMLGKQGTKMGGDQEPIKDDQEVYIEAAKNANAHGFVSGMPEGYDTSVGKYLYLDNYENFDCIPSSCIVLMVHVVKGHQYSTSHINAGASIEEMESETDSQPQQGQVSMLQS